MLNLSIAIIVVGIIFAVLVGSIKDEQSLEIVKDSETGCEYFVTKNGGIFPRMKQNGKHICTPPYEIKEG